MRVIRGDSNLLRRLEADRDLQVCDIGDFEARYDDLNERFHSHFSSGVRDNFVKNAEYHKSRYIDLCKENISGFVVDVGNDKPFLSFYLRMLNRDVHISTISYDVPETPFDLIVVDIEQEPLPFSAGSVDKILFAEVLEHLWRDPAYAIFQMNTALKPEGEIFITTPNACEMHAIVCVLWQANPNQRNQFFGTLESGHLHLWSSGDLKILVETNGFSVEELSSFDAYKYTDRSGKVMDFVREVSPYVELMGESLLLRGRKTSALSEPRYDSRLFPDGAGVQFRGAVRSFAMKNLGLS